MAISSGVETPVLWWIKRDFRLEDCPALHRALETGRKVVALWIFEDAQRRAPEFSSFHARAQLQAAIALDRSLRELGGELCVAQGEVEEILERIYRIQPFHHMVSHQEVGGLRTFARDRSIKRWAKRRGVQWAEYRQCAVFRALDDRNHRQHYWRAWMQERAVPRPTEKQGQRIRAPSRLRAWLAAEGGDGLKAWLEEFRGGKTQRLGERYAKRMLDSFLYDRGLHYRFSISSPVLGAIFGSRISPHLAWGTMSPRVLYRALQERLQELSAQEPPGNAWYLSLEMFRARLHWRDHFMQRLECSPDLESRALCENFEAMFPREQDAHFQAWRRGETGFLLVDACVRCAKEQGFLNFRMRAMITSAACHILRIPWQVVGWEMAKWWTDYEPGIHWAQVQMQSGMTGISSNRIYDPRLQLRRLDPDTSFVKRWLPELAQYSAEEILDHDQNPLPSYPPARAHWGQARRRWREAYASIASSAETRAQQSEVLMRHGSRSR